MVFKKRYVLKNLTVFFYDVKYGIKNLFAYFKLIWEDRDWDFMYFEKMLLFKLNRIKNNYPIDYGEFMVGEDIKKEVTEAIRLLEAAIEADDVDINNREKRIDAYVYIAEHIINWWD